MTDAESFGDVATWLTEIERYASEGVNKLIVGNKSDLVDKRQVDYATAKEFCDRAALPLLETSAKDATNVEAAFLAMARQIKERVGAQQLASTGAGRVSLPASGGTRVDQQAGGGGACC